MQMQMKHGLPRPAAIVENGPIPREQIALLGDLRRDHLQLSQQALIHMRSVVQRRKMLLGTDQNVRGRLRADVLKRKHIIILKHNFRWNFFRPDFAEQAILVHQFTPAGLFSSSRITIGVNPSLSRNCAAKSTAASSPDTFPTLTR